MRALLLLVASTIYAQTAVYPGAVSTTANLGFAVNGVSTLLTSDISSSQTLFGISSCAGIVPDVLITIDQEIMQTTGCSGTVIVANRGFDGTSAVAHLSQATIYAYIDAWNVNSPNAEIIAVETALGPNLANVLTPGTGVVSFNTRHGNVVLLSADVAAVEQDLRTTASPNFVGLSLSGNTSVGGTLGVTGNTTLGGTLGVTGTTTLTGALIANGGCTGCVSASPSFTNLSLSGTLMVSGLSTLSGGLAAPVTISGNTSGAIVTATQSGAGTAITATGGIDTDVIVAATAANLKTVNITGSGGSGTCLDLLNGISTVAYLLCNGNASVVNLAASGTLSGTHLQNVGTGDSPTLATVIGTTSLNSPLINLTGSGTSALCLDVLNGITTIAYVLCNGNASFVNLAASGTVSGAHLQGVGTGDSPVFVEVSATTVEGTTVVGANFVTGITPGVTFTTCTQFTNGLCTAGHN